LHLVLASQDYAGPVEKNLAPLSRMGLLARPWVNARQSHRIKSGERHRKDYCVRKWHSSRLIEDLKPKGERENDGRYK
jgi:hypothetical protein